MLERHKLDPTFQQFLKSELNSLKLNTVLMILFLLDLFIIIVLVIVVVKKLKSKKKTVLISSITAAA